MPLKNQIALISIIITVLVTAFFFNSRPGGSDEVIHMVQIENFQKGDYSLHEGITTLPGYHYIMSVFAGAEDNQQSMQHVRLANTAFAILCIFLFYVLIKVKGWRQNTKLVQFALLPILFPFYFLVFTDVVSLHFVLLSYLLFEKKQFAISSVVIASSIFIRQMNIIWCLFFILMIVTEHFSLCDMKKNSIIVLKKTYGYLIVCLAFYIFYKWNHGVAMGDKWAHQGNKTFIDNFLFYLLCTFAYFLPLHIANFTKVLAFVKKHWIVSTLILIVVIHWVASFKANHPYNHQYQYVFLRNRIIEEIQASILIKIIFALCIYYTILSLIHIPFRSKKEYLLYIITYLLLLPSWLIEFRYYIVSLAFFVLFKTENTKGIEITQSIYITLLTCASIIGFWNNTYFP